MSVAGEGWTEPNIYLRRAQMQTSLAGGAKKPRTSKEVLGFSSLLVVHQPEGGKLGDESDRPGYAVG